MIVLLGLSLIGAGITGVFLAAFAQDVGNGLQSNKPDA
uniref:Uncharacterized protein n=1 Tax=uncultured Armatimonadetes bacterium TaxID=157466 RepID=A0A6J4ID75_9BACT|nr:hypothetical protein AVDCRST_MAG63-1712 [uncultured Armatimonadetes bacterium]